MGIIDKIIYEKLIPDSPDRNSNLLRVYRNPLGEMTIHFRNVKIVLHTQEEIDEWVRGFKQAMK